MAYPYYKNQNNSQKAPKAADKYKNYKYGQIAVTVQPGKGLDLKTRQPYKVINLYNIDADSAKAIVARLTDPSKNRITRTAWIDKAEPTHVQIKVFDSEIDSWLDGGDLNAVQAVLIQSGKYNNDEVLHLEDEIATGFYSKNKEKINQAHSEAGENAMQMWQNYLSKINDPVTLEQIKLYSRVYGNVSYGHVLSIKNATLIKSYDKDATFVLAPGKWKSLFGRGIKRGAKPLPMYVWVPNKADVADKDLEVAKNDNGWEDTDSQDLSVQVKQDLQMKANKSGGITLRSVGYDVRDTYLLSGAKEDKWTSEIGLLNNLNGELNAAAQRDKIERGQNNPEDVEGGAEMMKRTEKACAWMESYCEANGYDTNTQSQDAGNKLADYLLTYCTVNATKKANVLESSNIQTYAENATQITLILTNLALNALTRFHRTYEYDKKEATALMNVVFGIAKKLEENSVITEGIMSWLRDKASFVKMFFKALKQIGCRVVNKPQENQLNYNNIQQAGNNQPENNVSNTDNIDDIRNKFTESFNRINKNFFYDDINRNRC